jgi:hypothetical protein
MKIIIKSVLVATGVLIATSCNKSFLDKKPYNAVVVTDAIQSEQDMQVAMAGVYAGLRNTDLYGRTLPLKGDLSADNVYVTTSNSGRYISLNTYIFTSTDAYASAVWPNAYIVIKNANNVINATLASTGTGNIPQYVGEAYAVRALMHFELVRNFASPYTVNPNAAGIPIVTKFDQNSKPARNTVKDVYAQIIADLEKAYSLMTVYRGTGYFSKYAARALEARVYQTMGDWANAKITALDVVNNSGWVMLLPGAYVNPTGSLGTSGASPTNTYSPGGYWANATSQSNNTKNETLFEVVSDLLTNNGFDQIGFIYLQVGSGYGDMLATQELYNLYSATDVRKGLIPSPTAANYRSGQAGTIYLCYKYPNPAGSGDKDDTKILRLSDIILILAEAYYNTSDEANALLNLNKVAKQRDPAFTGYTSTGAQVLEDILTERRKELAFEGSRYWDLLRLKRTFTKVKNQNPLSTLIVDPSNPVLIFPIPQSEMDANKNMTQNPGY